MDFLTKKRYTFWIIFLLVVLNISTVSMLWLIYTRKPAGQLHARIPQEDHRTLQFLQKELDLTDTQIQQYEQLRQTHAEKIRHLINDIRQLKKEMMDEVFSNNPDSAKMAEIAGLIGNKQAEIERLTFEHFLDLKKLCGKDQVGKLQRLLDEFFKRNPPPREQAPPPPTERDRPMEPSPRENSNRK